jgi:hypothetical protein
MATTKRKEPSAVAILAAQLMQECCPGLSAYRVARDAEALIRLGRKAQRLAETQCNGVERWDAKAQRRLAQWTEQDAARNDKARHKVRLEVDRILCAYGAQPCEVYGDPRGFVIKWSFAYGASNGMTSGKWEV